MRPWLAAAALATVLALTLVYANLQRSVISDLRAEAVVLIAERNEARQALTLAQRRATQSNTDAQKARMELQDALSRVPDTAVPPDVSDSLCRTLRCVQPGGVPAPAR